MTNCAFTESDLAKRFKYEPIKQGDYTSVGYWSEMLRLAQALSLNAPERNSLVAAINYYFNNAIEAESSKALTSILT